MNRWLWIPVILIALVTAAMFWWQTSGPTAEDFADLRHPRIMTLADSPVLEVQRAGDPNIVAADAFKALFGAYYQLPGISRSARPPAPRARWARTLDTNRKDTWTARYALPLPPGTPSATTSSDNVQSTTWTYGTVAEILHIGPYATEQADIDRLLAFIRSSGYVITGDHEEEYLKGPGGFIAGDPANYLTIIRYNIATSAPPAPPSGPPPSPAPLTVAVATGRRGPLDTASVESRSHVVGVDSLRQPAQTFMTLAEHGQLVSKATGIWLAFWLAGLPNYYQQYATVPLAVGCTLLAAAIGVAAVAVLSRHRPTRRLSYAVWVSFYFTLPLAVLDALYCGWYLDHGWVFVTRYWYLTVFYIVPWMTFVPVAILLNRLENRATMTRS
jgi:hypothetical protein